MSFDPKGTTPGLASNAQVTPKTLNMRCGKSSCDSMEVVEIKIEAPEQAGQRVYRCVKCGHVRPISVGGHLNV